MPFLKIPFKMDDTYKTILKKSEGLYKDKCSRFISYAYHVENEEEVRVIIQELKKTHHSARHHCYAWRIGTDIIRTRVNDDGEPSSTAGKPILGQLTSAGLTNILIVVVRYFGGTLLGASGLIHAYKLAAANALANAEIAEKTIESEFEITFLYKELNNVMQILKTENLTILKNEFSESCYIRFSVRRKDAYRVFSLFESYYGVKIKNLTQ
jgi:uncharacterized YigZ family protein